MAILDTIRRRRSIRKYSPQPVEEEKLKLILEAARLAPSSSNSQPWYFVVVRDKEKIKKISQAMPVSSGVFINSFMAEAPVIIVGIGRANVLHKFTGFFRRDNHVIDVAIAMEHMVLQAAELELGTCWIGWFNEKKIREILALPRGTEIVALLTLGYPLFPSTDKAVGSGHEKPRKSLAEIVSFQ